jgi:hypothetical protein
MVPAEMMDDEKIIRIIAAANISFFHGLMCSIRFLFKMKFGGKQNGLTNRIRFSSNSSFIKKVAYQINCGKVNLPPRLMEKWIMFTFDGILCTGFPADGVGTYFLLLLHRGCFPV